MKKISILILCGLLGAISLNAQNIFPANGRVGIYTVTPAASLQVKGGARIGTAANYLNVDSATGSINFVGTAGYRVANNSFAFTSASQPLAGLYFNAANVRYEFRNTSGTPAMVIGANAGGLVGIGTTSPTDKLTVQGSFSTANSNGSVLINPFSPFNGTTLVSILQGTTANPQVRFQGTAAGFIDIGQDTIGNFVVEGNDNPRLTVTQAGSVGIGIPLPAARLDIAGNIKIADGTQGANKVLTSDANGLASWQTPVSGGWSLSGNTGTTSTNFAGTTDNTSFRLRTNNKERMIIDSLGTINLYADAIIDSVAVGRGSGNIITNTAVGYKSFYSNTSGFQNTATGYQALNFNTVGNFNTATGYQALISNISGTRNTATGSGALFGNIGGICNTANGRYSLYSNTLGDSNTAVGYFALVDNISGSYNTALGSDADVSASNFTNASAIGYNAVATASNKVVIGDNTSGKVIGGYAPWSNLSDGRFKENVKEDVPGLKFINKLRPVTYTINTQKLDAHVMQNMPDSIKQKRMQTPAAYAKAKAKIQTGFIAQDVEKTAKEIGYNFDGVNAPQNPTDNYSIAYSQFVVPLVKAVQELSTANDAKDAEIADLEQRLAKLEALMNVQVTTGSSQPVTLNSSDIASLQQNAPNPFRSTTIINYILPQHITASEIVITDVKGNTIKRITVSASGSVTVAAGSLASGTYKYSLIVDGKLIDTKTMVLTK